MSHFWFAKTGKIESLNHVRRSKESGTNGSVCTFLLRDIAPAKSKDIGPVVPARDRLCDDIQKISRPYVFDVQSLKSHIFDIPTQHINMYSYSIFRWLDTRPPEHQSTSFSSTMLSFSFLSYLSISSRLIEMQYITRHNPRWEIKVRHFGSIPSNSIYSIQNLFNGTHTMKKSQFKKTSIFFRKKLNPEIFKCQS